MLPVDLREPPPASRGSVRLTRRGRVLLLLVLIVVLALVLGVGGLLIGRALHTGGGTDAVVDYPGPGTGRVVIEVKDGDSLSAIAQTLTRSGVVETSSAFLGAATGNTRATAIQPGLYALRAKMSGQGALALLLDPVSQIRSRVTIPEGTSLKRVVPLLATGTKITEASLQAALANPAALGLPAYAEGGVEGFLFPATYDVVPNETATALLRATVARFMKTADQVKLVDRARALGYTPRQIVTIASIIERESAQPADAARVARVFYNRLAAGLPLGSEYTVHYTGDDPANPYNTYTHKGFPPGPYNSPGEATLTAALNPAPGNWLYFVTLPKEGTQVTADEKQFAALSVQCKAEGGCK